MLIHRIFQVVTVIDCVVGMMASGFIVSVGSTDWMRRRKLPACDRILICLCSSRLLLQGTILHTTLFPELTQWNVVRGHSVLLVLASTACLWFAACLSVFYCLKIATFTQPCFLLMKLRISAMVPQLLLGSALISLVSSLPFIWVDYSSHLCNSTRSHLKNISFESPTGNNNSYFKGFVMYVTWAVVPLLFFIASSTLLIASLWKHIKQMRQNATGFKDSKTEAHITAIKSLISFLMLYICSFIAEILLGIPSCQAMSRWKHNICSLLIAVCPSVHSILLVLLNVRLKLAVKSILLYMKCHRKQDSAEALWQERKSMSSS
ncbi:taste receptor type 2 member 40-like [Pogona vitticeps]